MHIDTTTKSLEYMMYHCCVFWFLYSRLIFVCFVCIGLSDTNCHQIESQIVLYIFNYKTFVKPPKRASKPSPPKIVSNPRDPRIPASPTEPAPNNKIRPPTKDNPRKALKSITKSFLQPSYRKLNCITKKTGRIG
mmetsp:Transcript_37266/g.44941  ORF Transcript_37266/g.44941 Transcript_37266/m.44941 type:complete len:135 (-) Transcript_37266:240-644(-)